jgi:hypothetical protein
VNVLGGFTGCDCIARQNVAVRDPHRLNGATPHRASYPPACQGWSDGQALGRLMGVMGAPRFRAAGNHPTNFWLSSGCSINTIDKLLRDAGGGADWNPTPNEFGT